MQTTQRLFNRLQKDGWQEPLHNPPAMWQSKDCSLQAPFRQAMADSPGYGPSARSQLLPRRHRDRRRAVRFRVP